MFSLFKKYSDQVTEVNRLSFFLWVILDPFVVWIWAFLITMLFMFIINGWWESNFLIAITAMSLTAYVVLIPILLILSKKRCRHLWIDYRYWYIPVILLIVSYFSSSFDELIYNFFSFLFFISIVLLMLIPKKDTD